MLTNLIDLDRLRRFLGHLKNTFVGKKCGELDASNEEYICFAGTGYGKLILKDTSYDGDTTVLNIYYGSTGDYTNITVVAEDSNYLDLGSSGSHVRVVVNDDLGISYVRLSAGNETCEWTFIPLSGDISCEKNSYPDEYTYEDIVIKQFSIITPQS